MIRIYKTFFKREWRWQIKAANHKIISAATEGYKNRKDCIANMHLTYMALREHFKMDKA